MTTIIKIEWWDENNNNELPENNQLELREHAINRIAEMSKDGYTSGELRYDIDNQHYDGWWKLKEVK